jgi:cytochrome c oxidase subunit 2
MKRSARGLTRRLVLSSGLLATLAIAIASVAHAAPEPEAGFGYPRDVSVDGYRIDWLINITTVFCGILFVIMVAWMGIAMVKHGAKNKALYDHGSARKQALLACGLSALIFFVVDGNLFVTSMIDLDEAFWNFKKAESDPKAVRIEINGHQWAWDARYAGPDRQFNTADDIVTLNDIRVPIGVPIIFNLGSTDVLHSFYLPNLRQKQDAVPGTINHLWFTAKATGEYDIGCAQHCGVNHYKMKGVLTILAYDEWVAWAEQASANSKLAYDPDDTTAHWGWPWEPNI